MAGFGGPDSDQPPVESDGLKTEARYGEDNNRFVQLPHTHSVAVESAPWTSIHPAPVSESGAVPISQSGLEDRGSDIQRAKNACVRCKQRKTKCTGGTVCRNCYISGSECVYKEKDKRVAVTESNLRNLKERIKYLEEQLSELREKNKTKSVDAVFFSGQDDSQLQENGGTNKKRRRSSLLNMQSRKDFLESGSSDMVIMKLTAMQERSRGNSSVGDVNHNSSFSETSRPKKGDQIPFHAKVSDDETPRITLEEADRLLQISHFFLNSVYLPFELSAARLKLAELYAGGELSFPNSPENKYWKPLILILFALGHHYSGSHYDGALSKIPEALIRVAFEEFFPLRDMDPQAAEVALVASLYFRAISQDNDAMFYSNLSIEIAVMLGMHKKDLSTEYTREEIEHRSRVFWVSFGVNRFLGAKMGHPLLLSNKEIDRDYPDMVLFEGGAEIDVPFPNAQDFKFFVELARIAEDIGNVIYKERQDNYGDSPDAGFLESIADLIQRLINWNEYAPPNLKINLNEVVVGDGKAKRLRCSIHLNYCYCIHLTTIPILYRLLEKRNAEGDAFISIDDLPQNISTMLSICLNAAQLTINILATCFNEKMLAVFGVMDLDYVFSSALTFFMAMILGVDVQLYSLEACLNACFNILGEMSKRGNASAVAKLSKLVSLIKGYETSADAHNNSVVSRLRSFEALSSRQETERAVPEEPAVFEAAKPLSIADIDSVISMPAQVVDTSFLPSATEDKLDFLKDTDLEFWENAYKSAHTAADWDELQKYLQI